VIVPPVATIKALPVVSLSEPVTDFQPLVASTYTSETAIPFVERVAFSLVPLILSVPFGVIITLLV